MTIISTASVDLCVLKGFLSSLLVLVIHSVVVYQRVTLDVDLHNVFLMKSDDSRISPLLFRTYLHALPDGRLHLCGIRGHWLVGGCVLLHVFTTQTADPAAYPLFSAQLPGRDHPHDLDCRRSPHHTACTVTPVQHGHH